MEATQLQLEIPSTIQTQFWQAAQAGVTVNAKWNSYLNQVCLSGFLPWLQADYAPEAIVYPNAAELPSFWDIVNGTAIDLDNKRLILIPNKTIDTSELQIPQEWVDLPSWAGDYYLAVQVNSDELWVRVWGYTTHEQIKAIGRYDADDRTYRLDAQDLIQDLSVLWVVRQLNPDEITQAEVAALPAVPLVQTENLLQRLANPAILQPRLELPFQLWGALLEQPDWRQRLFQLRRGEASPTRVTVNLSQWLQNVFEEGWQSLENLLGSETAFNFRQANLNETAIRRVKLLNLYDRPVLLLVALDPEADGRIAVRAQLRSHDSTLNLPENLRLSLLSSTGEVIQAIEARSQDDGIQLQRFKSAPGTRFSLQVAIENAVITEDFQL